MEDHELVALIRRGDTETPIKILYQEWPKIKALIISSGGDETIAQHIFHDSLILLIEKVAQPDFELKSKLSTFLYGINRFLWKNELRKRKKNVELEWKDTLIVEASDIDYDIEKEGRIRQLITVLDKISERCKVIFELFYFEKKSMQFIADQLGYTSVNSAKTQKYKCMEKAIVLARELPALLLVLGLNFVGFKLIGV